MKTSIRPQRIIFRFHDDAKPALGATTVRLTLHEALCKAIHEHDAEALHWLGKNIADIGL